jgi:hypothetical protein
LIAPKKEPKNMAIKKNISHISSARETFNNPATTYRQMANATLQAMLAEMQKKGSWQDSEQEDPKQSLLYKRVEALSCFLMPLEIQKVRETEDIVESNKWFFAELSEVLSLIKKDGFDPNPYTYIKEQKFNFVDCASSVLELLIFTKKHLSSSNSFKAQSSNIEKIAYKAFHFLSKVAITEKDKRISWAANELNTFKGESLSNVYFTSYAVKSLAILHIERPWKFVEESSGEILNLIQAGVNWLLDRFDEKKGLLYFDKQKKALSYFDYGLMIIAMSHVYDYLSDIQRMNTISVSMNFINAFPNEFEGRSFMYFLPPKAKSPAYYDNRLSFGVLVTALCRITIFASLPSEVEETLQKNLGIALANLLRLRGGNSNLWDEYDYLITSTMWGILGLLNMDVFGKATPYLVQEAELYRIIRKAFSDPRVVKIVLQVIQEGLLAKEKHDIKEG